VGPWAIAGIVVGVSFLRSKLEPKPRSEDPRTQYKPMAASYGQVLPVVYGTPLISAPALARGHVEAHGDVWRQHQLALGLCQGPIHSVRAVWLSDGAQQDTTKTTKIEWARMVECGAVLQAGTLTGHTPTTQPFLSGSERDVTVTKDSATQARLTIKPASARRFPSTLASSLRIADGAAYHVLFPNPSVHYSDVRLDGTYTVTNFTDTEITLNITGVSRWSPLAAGTAYDLIGVYTLSTATGGTYFPGIAHIRADPLDLASLYRKLDASTTLTPTYEAEVSGQNTVALAGPETLDVEAADLIADLLGTNYWAANLGETVETTIGAGGTSASGARMYCRAMGFYLSVAFTEQRPIADHLQDVLDSCDLVALCSENKIKVLPLGDAPITANGATYTPNTTPVYDLGPGSILASGQQPMITVSARPDALAANVISVEYRNRAASIAPYRVTVETAFDAADIEEQAALVGGTGKVEASPAVLHGIVRAEHAKQIAHLRLQRARAIRNGQAFKVGWRYALIEGMDLVTVTDPAQGISLVPVRVLAVEETESDEIALETVDWPIGIAGATQFETSTSDEGDVATGNPGVAEVPIVAAVPAYLAGATPEIWVGATGYSPRYGGCDVYLSADGTTYNLAGTIQGRSTMGALTATLPTGDSLDTVNSVSVDLGGSLGILSSTTEAGRDSLETLCWVDGELLAYETATEDASDAHTYALTGLRRGAYASLIGAHVEGARFLRLDSRVLRVEVPVSMFGVPLYVKLLPFSLWGSGQPALADVTAHTVTLTLPVPDAPATCTLAISPAPPAPAGDQWREAADENLHGRWARVQWTFDDPYTG
jgi:hypothetical protein